MEKYLYSSDGQSTVVDTPASEIRPDNNKDDQYELWTIFYPGSGRPDRFLGSFVCIWDARLFADNFQNENPCSTLRIGKTKVDDEGFLQWV